MKKVAYLILEVDEEFLENNSGWSRDEPSTLEELVEEIDRRCDWGGYVSIRLSESLSED